MSFIKASAQSKRRAELRNLQLLMVRKEEEEAAKRKLKKPSKKNK